MAFRQIIFVLFALLIWTNVSDAQKPKALVLPVTKDSTTLQYLTRLKIGTPLTQRTFVVDLGGKSLWMECITNYKSSTYKAVKCGTAPCTVAKAVCFSLCLGLPPMPGCHNNTCRFDIENSVTGAVETSEATVDTISLQSTDGSKTLSPVSVPNFIFGCNSDTWNLEKLASGASGMLGLSKERIAFPSQLSSSFGGSFRRKFAICLPSNFKSGVLFFGDSPYVFYPGYNTSKAIDVSSRFSYTKLHPNYAAAVFPKVQGALMPGYFVKITSILVNGKTVPVNSTLLDFHSTGYGGSTISTIQPYTVLHSSIYESLVKVFDAEIASSNVRKVSPVAPFKDCYNVRNMAVAHLLGLTVPDISLVFENKNVKWDIYGANSMVKINQNVACLGFIDGGASTTASVVIGAHQLQDNLVQFDLASSRMAFTSTLLFEEVECSNFKF